MNPNHIFLIDLSEFYSLLHFTSTKIQFLASPFYQNTKIGIGK